MKEKEKEESRNKYRWIKKIKKMHNYIKTKTEKKNMK